MKEFAQWLKNVKGINEIDVFDAAYLLPEYNEWVEEQKTSMDFK